jgi:hypothetical protein
MKILEDILATLLVINFGINCRVLNNERSLINAFTVAQTLGMLIVAILLYIK